MQEPSRSPQRGRRSRGERLGIAVLIGSFVLGFAWMFGSVALMRAGFMPGLWRQTAGKQPATFLFLPHVMIVPGIAVGGVLARRGRRRALRELIELQGKLCLRCHYKLEHALPAGRCPECGTPYDPGSLKRGWCRTYPNLGYEIDWPTAPAPPVRQ